MVDSKEIGRRLTVLRGNMRREYVAGQVGVSLSAITMYENGERIPRDEVKIKIAQLYRRSVQEIFFDEKCHI